MRLGHGGFGIAEDKGGVMQTNDNFAQLSGRGGSPEARAFKPLIFDECRHRRCYPCANVQTESPVVGQFDCGRMAGLNGSAGGAYLVK